MSFLHQIDKRQILKRFDKKHITKSIKVFTEDFMDRFAHIGIKMHRIDKVNIGIFRSKHFYRFANRDKPITEILTSMSRNQY